MENGVQYRNVESYLKELPNFEMQQSVDLTPQTLGPVL